MLPVLPYWIFWTAPWVVFAFAVVRGGAPERTVAVVTAARLAYNIFVQPHRAGQMLGLDLAEQTLQLAVVLALALKYDRWWLLVAGAAQVLLVATIAAGLLVPLHWWTAGTVMWTWASIYLGALAVGAWNAPRRRRALAAQVGALRPAIASGDADHLGDPQIAA